MLIALLFFPASAQKNRPKIIQPKRTQYAGKLLLLPRDSGLVAWKLPRQIARIVDYDVVYPPRELLGDKMTPMNVDGIITWAKQQDYAQLKGVIVALDALLQKSADTTPEQIKQRLDFVNWVRGQKADLPLYGFAQRGAPELSPLVFDDLWIGDQTDVAPLIVARFLTQTYQRPPKIRPLTSVELTPTTLAALKTTIAATGGELITTGKADIFLFIHTPNTDETKLTEFADALAQTLAAGYYVALADVSGAPEKLFTILQTRKQLDLLQAYAASPVPAVAFGKTLAHIATRMIAAKVLRTSLDEEQLRRAERAHVELLLSRYLEDWSYAVTVRPQLELFIREQLQAAPDDLGDKAEQAETFLQTQMQRQTTELFTQQFKYNVHSVRRQDGFRIDFQIANLLRVKAQLPSRRTDEIELDIGVHLPMLVGLDGSPLRR